MLCKKCKQFVKEAIMMTEDIHGQTKALLQLKQDLELK